MDVPPTGAASPDGPGTVASALLRLDGVAELPLEQRPVAFEAIHDDLRSALAEIDDA